MTLISYEEELNKSGVLICTNKGVSMMPLLRQGKDIMIIHAKKDKYKKNDAALFKRDTGEYVLHRVRKVYKDGYFIIGDNCYGGEFVRQDQMLGILTAVKRNGKEISVDNFIYKLYVHAMPVRRAARKTYYALRAFGGRIFRKLFRRNHQ